MSKAKRVRWWRRVEFLAQSGGSRCEVVPFSKAVFNWYVYRDDAFGYSETGHVGWCWWAMGSMGDAPTYEAARDSAVAEIQRRVDRRVAVL